MKQPHISIKGERVFTLAGMDITNSVLATSLVVIAFVFLAYYFYSQSQKSSKSLLYYALQSFFLEIYKLFESVLKKNSEVFFPLLGAFFFFILLNNWSGLFPGVGSILITPSENMHSSISNVYAQESVSDHIVEVKAEDETHMADESSEDAHHSSSVPLLRGGTADLNTTLALALASVLLTQFFGIKFIGIKAHIKKYIDLKNPMMYFLGPLEMATEVSRIISFAFRLYGNIFAGEVLLTIIAFLLPVFLIFVGSPMFFLELFVGLVQALVFTMLTAVFISISISKHH